MALEVTPASALNEGDRYRGEKRTSGNSKNNLKHVA